MDRQLIQYTIFVGLADRKTGFQKYSIEKYLSILKNVCGSYHVPFSFHSISGGYFHKDGRYIEENTLSLMLVDIPEKTVIEIAKDLCAFFNQESVMVTSSPTNIIFVNEHIE
ncbi:MAG TPA: hypothetical protein DDX72_02570 [Ruminococcaceae bacterium]|nr:hypothetical protein [Oscillospiraceae bacterium]